MQFAVWPKRYLNLIVNQRFTVRALDASGTRRQNVALHLSLNAPGCRIGGCNVVDSHKPLTRRLCALSECDGDTVDDIEAMQTLLEVRRGGSEICHQGSRTRRAFAVVSGWLLRTRILSDGRRQVLGFVLPGDVINLAWHSNPVVPCNIECLTDATIVDIGALREHVMRAPFNDPVCAAVRSSLAMDDAAMLSSVSRLARQSAYERLALLLLDLRFRLSLVSLADATSFHMPVTQQVLSDALGLSIVHVNRTLMQLRRDGFVQTQQRMLMLPDPEALARLVDYAEPAITDRELPVSTPSNTVRFPRLVSATA